MMQKDKWAEGQKGITVGIVGFDIINRGVKLYDVRV